jgi:3,4-dihydroxy 2-butanone 4-phosphate synthase/GTP cyclohydrolase II
VAEGSDTIDRNEARRAVKEASAYLSPIADIIEDIRNGRMVILVDDEKRENEGDLVIPAQMATPDAINFMAKHGRGLVCLALSRQRVEQLGLPLMAQNNRTRHQTAFTVSIEARTGVTTGISASDRARTIAVAIDPTKGKDDIITPGHVFPLVAQDGGVLQRTGHTEASVDIARLAGFNPAGVICEIMNDDGTMARLPDLVAFAQFHGLKIGTIADLIAYRLQNDSLVERVLETRMRRRHGGEFRVIVFVNRVSRAEHIALVKGNISGPEPVLVRMHAVNILDDVLHDETGGHTGELESALRIIGEAGRGVVVLIREPMAQRFSHQIRLRHDILHDPSAASSEISVTHDEPRDYGPPALRDYGVGAQIVRDLGVKDMILLTNRTRAIVGLEGYGLRIVGRRPIPPVVD